MPKKIDYVGRRIGKLLVASRVDQRGYSEWNCLCDCGKTLVVKGASLNRKDRPTLSCGCIRIHHGVGTPEYRAWRHMINRCTNPNVESFQYYGSRGITFCERWNDFRNFLADMGKRPDRHSLDRIDVNGNYEPANCRWADAKTQARNTRRNRKALFNGEMICVPEIADKLNVKQGTVYSWVYKKQNIAESAARYFKNLERKGA